MEHDNTGIEKNVYRPNGGVCYYLQPGYGHCWKCNKVNKKESNFFKLRYLEDYVEECKDCVNEAIDGDMVKTIPYLDKFDIPLIPDNWKLLKERAEEKGIF